MSKPNLTYTQLQGQMRIALDQISHAMSSESYTKQTGGDADAKAKAQKQTRDAVADVMDLAGKIKTCVMTSGAPNPGHDSAALAFMKK